MRKESLAIRYEEMGTDIPYYVFEGKESGPHFMLSAGMHGDEINGVAIVSRFLQWFQDEKLEEKMKGKLTVVPVLNPSGFAHMQRRVFEDGKDLNRCFGVDAITTYSEFYAKELVEKLFHDVDYGIDVHDAGLGTSLYPHARIHFCDPDHCDHCTRQMSKYFGCSFAFTYERHGKKGMLAPYMISEFGSPFITIESGGGSSIDEVFSSLTTKGIKQILSGYGLFDGAGCFSDELPFLSKRTFVKTEKKGYFIGHRSLGSFVSSGDFLGTFFDPIEQESYLLNAPCSGYLISQRARQHFDGSSKKSLLSLIGDESGSFPDESVFYAKF